MDNPNVSDKQNSDNSAPITDIGSLAYTPKKPESAPLITPVEATPLQEEESTPEAPKVDNQPPIQTPKSQPYTPPVSEPVEVKVMDKTNEPQELHNLEETADKTSQYADEEEEEFIEGVDAAHGSQ